MPADSRSACILSQCLTSVNGQDMVHGGEQVLSRPVSKWCKKRVLSQRPYIMLSHNMQSAHGHAENVCYRAEELVDVHQV